MVSARRCKVGPRSAPRGVLKESAEAIVRGGVAVFPTDTVYGLSASAFRPEAISRIYRLKGRSYKKPLPFLVARFEQAAALVEPISVKLRELLDAYWPGPLTVVFKCSSLGRWVTGGKDTIAVRIPKHPVALGILRAANIPLATTSANRSGRPPAVTGAEAWKGFGDKVQCVVDAGRCPGGEASTVLDASHFHWTLIREGAVKKEALLRYIH